MRPGHVRPGLTNPRPPGGDRTAQYPAAVSSQGADGGTTGTPALGEVERELTRLLRRARTAQQSMATDIHPDLDAAGYATLVTMHDLAATHPSGVRATDVSTTLQLHKSTTSRNLAELERLGLIERVPDPEDARARLLRITRPGQQSLERSRAGRRVRVAAQLAQWPSHDVAELGRLLRRLNDDLA